MSRNIPTPITDHKEQSLLRLLQQYKNADNVKSIINIYNSEIQQIETLLNNMITQRLDINKAFGAQLDKIGEFLGASRGSLNDEQFREVLFVKIGTNTSEGTPRKIVEIAKLITGSAYVHYLNLTRGEYELELTEDFLNQDAINRFFADMQQVTAAGIRLGEVRVGDEGETFGFSGSNDPPYKGFSNASGTIGGKFVNAYRRSLPFAFANANNENTDPSTEGFGGGFQDPLIGGAFIS